MNLFKHINDGDDFLIQCKRNYFLNIRPGGVDARKTKEYSKLSRIAKSYFENGLEREFAGFLMESQYFINLWAAHLILEYGRPDNELKEICIQTIVYYSDNPGHQESAVEEKVWLEKYLKNHFCN